MGQLMVAMAAYGVASLVAWQSFVIAHEHVNHALGSFEYDFASNGLLVAAPHGKFDAGTDLIAVRLAQAMNSGFLVARGFVVNKNRINVNRPTEGIGRRCSDELYSHRAQDVYDAYMHALFRAGCGSHLPLRFYVEIHGNSSLRTAKVIEVATIGIPARLVMKIKARFSALTKEVLSRDSSYPNISLRMEPQDQIYYAATCAKRIGTFSSPMISTGMHIELPLSVRKGRALESTVWILSEMIEYALELQD